MGFAHTIFWISSGVAVWALHFAAIYGATTLACARGSPGAARWIVGIATLLAAGLAIAIIAKCLRGQPDFVRTLAAGTAAMALVAIAWEAAGAFTVAPCVP